MPGRKASRSHLPLIVMPQRCSVLHGIWIGDQDGCQARVVCNPKRPKSQSQPRSATFGGCDSRNNLMPGQRASRSHLFLIVMPQRCSVVHGIGIGDQDGCQARVVCNPKRPKSQPRSATFGGCDSRNNLMPGQRASSTHLPFFIMPQRCSVFHGIGIGDHDGCQARVFSNPTRPKSEPKSATFGGCNSRNNLTPGRGERFGWIPPEPPLGMTDLKRFGQAGLTCVVPSVGVDLYHLDYIAANAFMAGVTRTLGSTHVWLWWAHLPYQQNLRGWTQKSNWIVTKQDTSILHLIAFFFFPFCLH